MGSGITVQDVTVRYGEVVAVDRVDLRVAPGQLVAVSGPSGAGKSSLLWAIAGALRPAIGAVTVDDLEIWGRAEAARYGVVLIPQGNGLARTLTAYENVAVPLLADGLADVHNGVLQALTDVGLADSANHLVEELSGGEQQRVAVARGLARRGRTILADESTSELDGGNRERIVALLRREARRGAAVLIATHDPEVAAVADAHAVMDEGRLTWARLPTTVTS
jgi:putative ABC transport system ATP-binding protein